MDTIKFEDVTLEISCDLNGYVHIIETVESALNRVANVFGFDKKRITPLFDNDIDDLNADIKYEWHSYESVYTEGYFKVGKIVYHFRFDTWDNFKPSLFSEL